jgi:hypothetical protein
MNLKKIFRESFLPVLTAIILVSGVVYAWSEPTSAPPTGNADAPINTGANGQTKSGDFTSGGKITANQFCLGGVCISAWPSGTTTTTNTNTTTTSNTPPTTTSPPPGPQLYLCPDYRSYGNLCDGSCYGQTQVNSTCWAQMMGVDYSSDAYTVSCGVWALSPYDVACSPISN